MMKNEVANTVKFEIRVAVLADALKEIKRINKKATKNGLPLITFETSEPYEDWFEVYEPDFGVSRNGLRLVTKYRTKFVTLTVTAPEFKIGEWEVIARIEHTSGGNMIYSREGVDLNGADFNNNCDHCGHDRYRKDTFILRNAGEIKQVGSTCLKDFVGFDPNHAIWAFNGMVEIVNLFHGGINGSYDREQTERNLYLAIVAAIVEKRGFMGTAKARELSTETHHVESTCDLANQVYFSMTGGGRYEEYVTYRDLGWMPEERHHEEVKSALEWIGGESAYNDYMANLKVISNMEYITFRQRGFAASLIPAYHKAIEKVNARKVELEKARKSEHVGSIGERITRTVEIKKVVDLGPSDFGYGDRVMVIFEDGDGNSLVIYTTSNTEAYYDLFNEKGEHKTAISLTATVKKHNEWNGIAQTVIQRMKVNNR